MEIRQNDDKSIHIEGYANISNRPSRILRENGKTFMERIACGVFQRALNNSDNVDFLLNHDSDIKLGSTSEGNVILYEDSVGLRIVADVKHPKVIEAYNNGFSGFSFGFICNKDSFSPFDGSQLRTVEDMELLEVSLLDSKTTPAYTGVLVSAEKRSVDNMEIRSHIIGELQQTEDNTQQLEELRNFNELITLYLNIE